MNTIGEAPPGPRRLSLVEARVEFPLAVGSTYLDVASRAPMADRVAAELEAYLEICRTRPLPKEQWLARVESIRGRVARLMGAEADEIAFTKSTSDGLNLLAAGLRLAPGDNVVLCPEIEHANNVYLWMHLREQGIELRSLPAVDHAFPIDDAMDRVNERTRILSLSSTSFVTGARADLRELASRCYERGVFLLVDAVQELGAMAMDLRELRVDGLAVATQKMLLGSYGLGVMYCRRERLAEMHPPFLTRMGVAWDGGHESDLDAHYRLVPGAARFEVGNPNFAGLFALDAALSLLEDVGPERVQAHVLELARRLLDGLECLPIEVITPAAPGAHAGLVVFRPDDPARVHAELVDAGITTALRRGALRASVHLYNDASDVDHFLDVLARLLRYGGRTTHPTHDPPSRPS